MSTKLTKAELEARLAELEQENEALKNRPARARYTSGLWPNNNRRPRPDNPNKSNDPAWQGTIRMVVPPEKQAGDPLHIDISLWPYDPESSPVSYKQNPPDMSISISPCPPAREFELEAQRQKALGGRANGMAA